MPCSPVALAIQGGILRAVAMVRKDSPHGCVSDLCGGLSQGFSQDGLSLNAVIDPMVISKKIMSAS